MGWLEGLLVKHFLKVKETDCGSLTKKNVLHLRETRKISCHGNNSAKPQVENLQQAAKGKDWATGRTDTFCCIEMGMCFELGTKLSLIKFELILGNNKK